MKWRGLYTTVNQIGQGLISVDRFGSNAVEERSPFCLAKTTVLWKC